MSLSVTPCDVKSLGFSSAHLSEGFRAWFATLSPERARTEPLRAMASDLTVDFSCSIGREK